MKNIIRINLILILLMGLTLPSLTRASVVISNIKISNLLNNRVDLSWDTSQASKGYVHYGLKVDDLNMKIGYGAYDYYHTSTLTGIAKNQTYYYKIIAESSNGQTAETFVQSFSTKNMKDTQRPDVLDYDILQTTGNAVAIAWTTDEATKGKLVFAPEDSNRKRTVNYNSYDTYHVSYIYSLKNNTSYTGEITAIDKDGNKQNKYFAFRTSTGNQKGADLVIRNVQPIQLDTDKISDSTALLSWSTNYIAKSTIYYGTKSNKLNQKVEVSATPKYDHKVLLTSLSPNTIYYYKIIAEKGIYNKKIEATGYTFATLPKQQVITPQVAGEKIYNTSLDSDHDGYPDQEELDHKYNPYGYGRTVNEISARLSNPNSLESQKSAVLKNWLKNNFGAYSLSTRNWSVLVNAYAYGGYSEQDIKQAIKLGGKTVHPNIPFAQWQRSSDYQNYINK